MKVKNIYCFKKLAHRLKWHFSPSPFLFHCFLCYFQNPNILNHQTRSELCLAIEKLGVQPSAEGLLREQGLSIRYFQQQIRLYTRAVL